MILVYYYYYYFCKMAISASIAILSTLTLCLPLKTNSQLEWTMFVDAPDTYTVAGASRACPYAGREFLTLAATY